MLTNIFYVMCAIAIVMLIIASWYIVVVMAAIGAIFIALKFTTTIRGILNE